MKRIKAWIKQFIINTVIEDMKANGRLRQTVNVTVRPSDSHITRVVSKEHKA